MPPPVLGFFKLFYSVAFIESLGLKKPFPVLFINSYCSYFCTICYSFSNCGFLILVTLGEVETPIRPLSCEIIVGVGKKFGAWTKLAAFTKLGSPSWLSLSRTVPMNDGTWII